MTDAPDFNEQAGTFLRVDLEQDWIGVAAHEESVVRKAVVDYREKGRDSLVEVEARRGHPIAFVASSVVSFYLSTAADRARTALEEIHQEEWDRDFRKRHATPAWGDED